MPDVLGPFEEVRRSSDSKLDHIVRRCDAGVQKLEPVSSEGDQVPDEGLPIYLTPDGCREPPHGARNIVAASPES
jgi:hypothetical protein